VTSFTATDNVAVTGYILTETSTAPSAGAGGWTSSAWTSYTFSSSGTRTLYAWAKDAAGNVSTSRSATVTIDITPPTVTAFSIPSTATTLTVSITTFTATDNVAVTGYLLTETSTTPSPGAGGWTSSAWTSYTFSSSGTKTLYAWAKDGVGNVSASRSATVTIPAQPTSLSLSASSGFAGIDSFVITVGNGANMTVDLQWQYTPWGGGTQVTQNGTIGPMSSSGTLSWSLAQGAAPGLYHYTKIKNHSRTDWVNLTTQPEYTVRPPKPTSFSVSPNPVNLPSTGYTVTVGMEQSQTIVEEFRQPDNSVIQYSFTLDATGSMHPSADCNTMPGTYTILRVRNQLDSASDAWRTFNYALTFNKLPGCP
jgi:hypothetical protein